MNDEMFYDELVPFSEDEWRRIERILRASRLRDTPDGSVRIRYTTTGGGTSVHAEKGSSEPPVEPNG